MLGNHAVNFRGGYARHDNRAHELMRLPDANAGLAHERDLSVRFKLNHGDLISGNARMFGSSKTS
jgi:hypothetical protein